MLQTHPKSLQKIIFKAKADYTHLGVKHPYNEKCLHKSYLRHKTDIPDMADTVAWMMLKSTSKK